MCRLAAKRESGRQCALRSAHYECWRAQRREFRRRETIKENINIEFKREFTAELKKEVVAFANTNEKTIYIGIDDFGNILGIENADVVLNQVVQSIRNSIKPDVTIYCNSKIEKIENKNVIVIQVQRGALRPYYIAEDRLLKQDL